MAASGLSCTKPLVRPGWAISLLLHMNGLTKWSSGHVRPPFPLISGSEAIFSLCRGNNWPTAVTIASSLDSRCGLSLECVQDGCNGTGVKLEASNPPEVERWYV